MVRASVNKGKRKMTDENRSQEQHKNAFRSGPFRPDEENLTERSNKYIYINNGSVPLKEGVRGRWAAIKANARAFADAFHSGDGGNYGAFADPRFSVVAIMIALTGDWKGLAWWRHVARTIPGDALRRAMADFHKSLADDPVRNRAAALTARFVRLAARLGVAI